MRKMIALFVSTAFLLGTTGFAVAQTPAPAPAEKKMDDKGMDKKPAKKAMTCMKKAGDDAAKKADCEKKAAAAKAKMDKAAEKKDEKK